jgi:hypothetical protein
MELLILLILILSANGFLPGGSGTAIRLGTEITYRAETKQSTQKYINNNSLSKVGINFMLFLFVFLPAISGISHCLGFVAL